MRKSKIMTFPDEKYFKNLKIFPRAQSLQKIEF